MLKIYRSSIFNKEKISDNDGNSIVYRARLDGKTVAIKELTDDTDNLFDNEVHIMSLLDHAYIISLLAVIRDSAMPSLVMDYMPNGNLKEYLEAKAGLNDESKIDMARRIGRGLCYLHENNILHLDLKTENILIDEEEKPKICDFGYSVKLSDSEAIYKSEDVLGTPRWWTPEALEGDGATYKYYSRETDVYTYALILWSLYSETKPYHSITDHKVIEDAISAGHHEDEKQVTEPVLQNLCVRAWSLTPKDRPDIEEFVEKLQQLTLT